MELKSRQTYILRSLLEAEQEIPSAQLLAKLGIAKRTFYYDVEKINGYLAQHRMGRLVISGQHIRAEISDLAALDRQLRRNSSYYFSVSERHAMEILFIALNSEIVTIGRLMEYFDVSKNTALADIKALREELGGWSLSLHSAIKAGYQIGGEEANIRRFLWAQFRKLNTPEGTAAIKTFLQQSMVALTGNDIDFLELCRCLIKQYESDIGGDCFLDANGFESMMLQASWLRSRKGHEINMDSEEQFALMKTLSYRSVEFSVQKLSMLGMDISPKETYYITSLFLGIKTTDFITQEEENSYIAALAEQLILNFERIACITFPNRERLHGQLSHHIRPMYYRLKYGIIDKNPLTRDIQQMYPVVYGFTRRATMEVDTKMFSEISEDELAYLCVYFASNLNEKFVSRSDPAATQEVLIIGAGNMATATLVKEQLQDLFGFSFRYSVITVDRVRRWELDDYALVVSLVPLSRHLSCRRLVETGAILTETNQRKIMDVLKQNRTIARHDQLIQDILKLVEKNVEGAVQSERLYFDLFRYFDRREGGAAPPATERFAEKLRLENVVSLPEGTRWAEAVLCGARSLQGDRLADKMRNLLHSRRVQMYRLQEDVVLVHCPMQGEVGAKVDVRILVSREGVRCQDGAQAGVILCLSTADRYGHWDTLQEIYQYFGTPGHVDGVKQLYNREAG